MTVEGGRFDVSDGLLAATFSAISAIDAAQPPSIVPGHPLPARPAGALLGGRTDSHYRTSRLDIALRLTTG